jgi:hypothetical protein
MFDDLPRVMLKTVKGIQRLKAFEKYRWPFILTYRGKDTCFYLPLYALKINPYERRLINATLKNHPPTHLIDFDKLQTEKTNKLIESDALLHYNPRRLKPHGAPVGWFINLNNDRGLVLMFCKILGIDV